ncbi:hypothetical protein [Zavarzinia aquatilis]|uniref:Uncharacterized protein n=1 Tax=Zavarzinia aquatilis TaxID=2211142 RepID=A0A317EEN1_9PROT|nr:hypothetical protein [Zavarzinia aquatilis]PWR25498.1 hypothetical protein DKG74_00540 [Zavarzinia aquatilis]
MHMFPRVLGAVVSIATLCACVPASWAGGATEQLREAHTVKTAQGAEEWRLTWSEPPTPVCAADDVEMASTCPCSGFAYGEQGHLSIIRLRDGKEIDRLDLTPLFAGADLMEGGLAVLQRQAPRPDDLDRFYADDPKLAAAIARRPETAIMKFADYDRDGRAEEFLLQVGTLPCDKHQFVAIGLPKGADRLRALTAEGTEEPLVLPLAAWEALRRSTAPKTVETWACGDHGSEQREEMVVFARDGAISVSERSTPCAGTP